MYIMIPKLEYRDTQTYVRWYHTALTHWDGSHVTPKPYGEF